MNPKDETPMERLWPVTISEIAEEAVTQHGAIQKPKELEQLLYQFVSTYNINDPSTSILEIGVHVGGTYWAWREVADFVLGIDLKKRPEHEGMNIFYHDSHDPETVNMVANTLSQWDMIFIDGEHSMNSVLLDWTNYKQFLKPHGFMAFHDICPTFYYDMDTGKPCSVDKAWERIKIYGSKTLEFIEEPTHWGGIGIWYP